MTRRNADIRRANKAADAMHTAASRHGFYDRDVCVKAAAKAIRTGKTDAEMEEAFAFAGWVWDERFEYEWGAA